MHTSAFREDLFSGRVIVVTGALSEIGVILVRELAGLGASLALVDRHRSPLEKLRSDTELSIREGSRCTAHACAARDASSVRTVVAEIVAAHGRIDGLVNDAGGFSRRAFSNIDRQEMDVALQLVVSDGLAVMREVIGGWMAENSGAVVNLISDTWAPCAFSAHVGTASALLATMTESAAAEFGPAGVRVNCVAPNAWTLSATENRARPSGDAHPLADVSAGIVFLLSPAALPTNGVCIRIGVSGRGSEQRSDVSSANQPEIRRSLH